MDYLACDCLDTSSQSLSSMDTVVLAYLSNCIGRHDEFCNCWSCKYATQSVKGVSSFK